MPKANELKRGSIVEIDGTPHIVEGLQIQTPSARGGASFYKVRFRNLSTKQKVDRTFKGDDALGSIDFGKREVLFSYRDGDAYVFMDTENYTEYVLQEADIEDEKAYLSEDLEGIRVLIADGKTLGIELPSTVALVVADCSPPIKGASATARTKPATLTTGLVVQVPEYLAPGELIKVDTRTGAFLGRT